MFDLRIDRILPLANIAHKSQARRSDWVIKIGLSLQFYHKSISSDTVSCGKLLTLL